MEAENLNLLNQLRLLIILLINYINAKPQKLTL